jgi:hypothetical protein
VVRQGQHRAAVRADLHLSETAFESNPNGNLGDYLLDLAEEDPDALGASLVLRTDQEFRLDEKGRRAKGPDGEDLPPLWRPKALHAVDVVDTGDATRSFLSAGVDWFSLPDSVVRQASILLDQQFGSDADPAVVRARCQAWLDRCLELRYDGWKPTEVDTPRGVYPDFWRRRNRNRGDCP